MQPAAGPSLSLVIPAYNEAHRIEATLRQASDYLLVQNYNSELILVDDGSDDDTAAIATAFAETHPFVRVLTIPHGGKAAAVRAGMLSAIFDQIAFSDADLATPLSHLEDLRAAAANGCEVVIGSREGHGANRVGEPGYRHLMGRCFNLVVRLVALPGIDDTQCGFKLFQRTAADEIMRRARLYVAPGQQIRGPRVTAFDVELLVIARRLGYRICTVPVNWTYGTHSKVNPARDTWHNLRDVIRVRISDLRGEYR